MVARSARARLCAAPASPCTRYSAKRPMAEQPGPDRPLMIGAVALDGPRRVMAAVVGMLRCQRTQPVGGQQPTGRIARRRAAAWRPRAGCSRQADREDLVRPDRASLPVGAVDHVVEPAGRSSTKRAKPCAHAFGEAAIGLGGPCRAPRRACHGARARCTRAH